MGSVGGTTQGTGILDWGKAGRLSTGIHLCFLQAPSCLSFHNGLFPLQSSVKINSPSSGPFCLALLSPQSKQEVIPVLSLKIQSHFENFLSTNTGPNFGAFRI